MVREPLWEGLPFVNSLSEVAVRSIRDVFVGIVIFLFSTNYFFCYLFLDPQGYVKTQKLLHTLRVELYGAGSGIRTHEGVTPNGCHVNRRISRWDLEAVALTTHPSRRNSRPRPGRVLNHFQYLVESLDQRALEDTML